MADNEQPEIAEVGKDSPPEVNIQDLIDNAIGEKPDAFAAAFNDLMRARLSDAIDSKKIEMSATLFGAPGYEDTEVDSAIDQAHAETDDNGEVDDNAPEGSDQENKDGTSEDA